MFGWRSLRLWVAIRASFRGRRYYKREVGNRSSYVADQMSFRCVSFELIELSLFLPVAQGGENSEPIGNLLFLIPIGRGQFHQ